MAVGVIGNLLRGSQLSASLSVTGRPPILSSIIALRSSGIHDTFHGRIRLPMTIAQLLLFPAYILFPHLCKCLYQLTIAISTLVVTLHPGDAGRVQIRVRFAGQEQGDATKCTLRGERLLVVYCQTYQSKPLDRCGPSTPSQKSNHRFGSQRIAMKDPACGSLPVTWTSPQLARFHTS